MKFIKHKKENKKWIFAYILMALLFFTGAVLMFVPSWTVRYMGKLDIDQIIRYFMQIQRSEIKEMLISMLKDPIPKIAGFTVAFAAIEAVFFDIAISFKKHCFTVKTLWLKRIAALILVFAALAVGVKKTDEQIMFSHVVKSYYVRSGFVEDNYHNPKDISVTFPKQKRNLIHIYLESMENSFMSEDFGGNMPDNYIPELTALCREGYVFSDTDNVYGGARFATGSDWSFASMISQTSGLPMLAPGHRNYYGGENNYLPGAYTLGEMLEAQGYEQTLMIGAAARFAKLDDYYETHGNWRVFDYEYAKWNGYIPENYKVFWGFEDDKLYEFAKEEITRLYETGKPFNFTMETADTHYPDGYVTEGKETPFDSDYANALWNSDKDVVAFVRWIQEQPFYENTTVVLIGDHQTMATKFYDRYRLDGSYERTQYNCILNPAPEALCDGAVKTNDRLWANWDYFPTIVAALGGQIEGERLGIGTNLFSGEPTVFEQYGTAYVNGELEKNSPFFDREILCVEKRFDAVYTQTT